MNNTVQRLLLFCVGIPAAVLVILFMPWFHQLAASIVIVVFCVFSAMEVAALFRAKGVAVSNSIAIFASLPILCAAYLGTFIAHIILPAVTVLYTLMLIVLVNFVLLSLRTKARLIETLPQGSAALFIAIYPGLLGAFIVLIAAQPGFNEYLLLLFLILVNGNDSMAWLVGVTLGKRRGLFQASPNKSLEGFISGTITSLVLPFIFALAFPQHLAASWWKLLILGASMAFGTLFGDLFESALKRSSMQKDSGKTIPGRGGFLDTFDSLLFSAPIFYCASLILGIAQ